MHAMDVLHTYPTRCGGIFIFLSDVWMQAAAIADSRHVQFKIEFKVREREENTQTKTNRRKIILNPFSSFSAHKIWIHIPCDETRNARDEVNRCIWYLMWFRLCLISYDSFATHLCLFNTSEAVSRAESQVSRRVLFSSRKWNENFGHRIDYDLIIGQRSHSVCDTPAGHASSKYIYFHKKKTKSINKSTRRKKYGKKREMKHNKMGNYYIYLK